MLDHHFFDIAIALLIIGSTITIIGLMLDDKRVQYKTRFYILLVGFWVLCGAFGAMASSRNVAVEERELCEASAN